MVAMIRRRATATDIETRIGNHSFRATGITVYMQNGGTLEGAQQIANRASPRTANLYDGSNDAISPDLVERVVI